MADTTIDTLKLDIDIKTTENAGKKIKSISNSLDRLNEVVKKIDTSQMSSIFDSMSKSVSPFISQVKSAEKGLIALSKVARKVQKDFSGAVMPKKETVETNLGQGQAEQVKSKSGVPSYLKMTSETAKSASGEVSKLSKRMSELTKNSVNLKKPLNSIIKSMGRIAFYRAIRTILKEITQSIREGAKFLAKMSPEFNDAMSSITSSVDKLRASLTVVFYQIIIEFAPHIERISNKISQFANNFSLALATMRGSGTYIKTNTEYWKDYEKAISGTLFSFDTFQKLGGDQSKIDYEKLLIQEKITDASEEELKNAETISRVLKTLIRIWDNVRKVVTKVFNVMKRIWDTKVIQTIMGWIEAAIIFADETGALEYILWGVVAVLGVLALMNPFSQIVLGVTAAIFAIKMLIDYFDEILSIVKRGIRDIGNFIANIGIAVANTFITLVNMLIDFINILLKPLDWIVGLFGGKKGAVKIPNWEAKIAYNPIPMFAEGGQFKTADMFYANEDGKTELITSTNSGGSVMNISQWEQVSEQAFLNALYKYGAAQNGREIQVKTFFDGAEVARSKGFTGEINRRNPKLNLV